MATHIAIPPNQNAANWPTAWGRDDNTTLTPIRTGSAVANRANTITVAHMATDATTAVHGTEAVGDTNFSIAARLLGTRLFSGGKLRRVASNNIAANTPDSVLTS
ncbi:hypothetical protein MBOU_37310 [Mycobacterium bourgelatii]|uniref:Uncharacterized protein n=1 Tax=Mycobacterium bourgelatii TaxID=1273442 RepID=A0A7I9YSL5_MYCBU|nr:hypothetical protein MBOU_37310 [Mycobacterium bourgelatii]